MKKNCNQSFHKAVHDFRDLLLEDDEEKKLTAPQILKTARDLAKEALDHIDEPDAEHLADLLYAIGADPHLNIPEATEKKLSVLASELYEKIIIDESSKPWPSLRGTDAAKVAKAITRAIESRPKKRDNLLKLVSNLAQYSDEQVAQSVIEQLLETGIVDCKPPLIGKSPREGIKSGKKI